MIVLFFMRKKKDEIKELQLPLLLKLLFFGLIGMVFVHSLFSLFEELGIGFKSDIRWGEAFSLTVSTISAVVIAFLQHRIERNIDFKNEKAKELSDKTEIYKEIVSWFANSEAIGISGNIGYDHYHSNIIIKSSKYYIKIHNKGHVAFMPNSELLIDSDSNKIERVKRDGDGFTFICSDEEAITKLFYNAIFYKKNYNLELYLILKTKGVNSTKEFFTNISFTICLFSGFNSNCEILMKVALNSVETNLI